MSSRMLLLKLSATLATIICGGCMPSLIPSPQPKAEPQTLRIEVVGEGKVSVGGGAKVDVGGDATITAKPAAADQKSTLCPCCGATGVCRGLCGKDGCDCSRGQISAASTVGNAVALPQTQTQMVYQCRNGVCGWYPVSVTASAPRRAATNGKIVIFDNGSAAGRAMRDAIGTEGVDWRNGTPPAINGTLWWPTAVKPDGSAWTPGAGGWHGQSAAQFEVWRGR